MERTLSDFLETLFMASAFAGAMITAVYLASSDFNSQKITSDRLSTNRVFSSVSLWEHEENIIGYAELCSRMMRTLDYDVEINGVKIIASQHNFNTFNYNLLQPGSNYRVTYKYNADGSISTVCYTRI